MIERQIEAPVLPGDDDGQFPLVDDAYARPSVGSGQGPYIEPGGLVDIAVNELGGRVTSVELLPDEEP
jgi:hypothetical protein